MKLRNSFFNFILLSILVAGLISIFVGWLVLIYPFKSIVLLEPIQIMTSPVYAGGQMQYRVHFYKYTHTPVRITRSLVNDHTINFTPITSDLDPGEHNKIIYLMIPSGADTGLYHLSITYEYDVNFMRTVTKKFKTVPFMVYNEKDELLKKLMNEQKSNANIIKGIEKKQEKRDKVILDRDKVYEKRDKIFDKRNKVYEENHKK
jgi:hypothetical protein